MHYSPLKHHDKLATIKIQRQSLRYRCIRSDFPNLQREITPKNQRAYNRSNASNKHEGQGEPALSLAPCTPLLIPRKFALSGPKGTFFPFRGITESLTQRSLFFFFFISLRPYTHLLR